MRRTKKCKVSLQERLKPPLSKVTITHFDKFGVPETVTQRESINYTG